MIKLPSLREAGWGVGRKEIKMFLNIIGKHHHSTKQGHPEPFRRLSLTKAMPAGGHTSSYQNTVTAPSPPPHGDIQPQSAEPPVLERAVPGPCDGGQLRQGCPQPLHSQHGTDQLIALHLCSPIDGGE